MKRFTVYRTNDPVLTPQHMYPEWNLRGTYSGETAEEALEAMAQDHDHESFAVLCSSQGVTVQFFKLEEVK